MPSPMKQREFTSEVQSYELSYVCKSYKLSRKIHTIVFFLVFINPSCCGFSSRHFNRDCPPRFCRATSLLFVSCWLINQKFCGTYYWVISTARPQYNMKTNLRVKCVIIKFLRTISLLQKKMKFIYNPSSVNAVEDILFALFAYSS